MTQRQKNRQTNIIYAHCYQQSVCVLRMLPDTCHTSFFPAKFSMGFFSKPHNAMFISKRFDAKFSAVFFSRPCNVLYVIKRLGATKILPAISVEKS